MSGRILTVGAPMTGRTGRTDRSGRPVRVGRDRQDGQDRQVGQDRQAGPGRAGQAGWFWAGRTAGVAGRERFVRPRHPSL
ncbi:hypothetical protein GCM10010247_09730 [Streptomyces calvus]|nr:hypothetical protein GCM10010247_09730 [Streptomyces calvus]